MNEYEYSYSTNESKTELPPPPKPPKIKIIPKSKGKLFYVLPAFTTTLSLIVLGLLFFFKTRMIWIILYGVFIFPVLFFSGLIFFVRLYLDRNKIKGEIIKKVSKNFIIANFYRENRRIKKVVVLINKDGKTFNYNKGIYCIDKETIWLDDNNHPNCFYLENLPNPIIFGFQEDTRRFLDVVLQEKSSIAKDKNGRLIDLSFSSETLQQFKKDKIFQELMRDAENTKMLYILFGILALSFIAIIIVAVVK